MLPYEYELLDKIGEFRRELRKKILESPAFYTVSGIPKISGVYVFIDKDDKILYVGRSVNIRLRWQQRTDFSLTNGKRLVVLMSVEHSTEGAKRYFDIDSLEALLIALFAPKYNQVIRCKVNPIDHRYTFETPWA